MLHALPALLDDLERRLVNGEDPLPLLTGTRWAEIVGWPQNREDALRLKVRLNHLQTLLAALQAPLQAALSRMNENPSYGANGRVDLPENFSLGLQTRI